MIMTEILASVILWWIVCYEMLRIPECDRQGLREDCEVARGGGTHAALLVPSVDDEHMQPGNTIEDLSQINSVIEDQDGKERIQNEEFFKHDHFGKKMVIASSKCVLAFNKYGGQYGRP